MEASPWNTEPKLPISRGPVGGQMEIWKGWTRVDTETEIEGLGHFSGGEGVVTLYINH